MGEQSLLIMHDYMVTSEAPTLCQAGLKYFTNIISLPFPPPPPSAPPFAVTIKPFAQTRRTEKLRAEEATVHMASAGEVGVKIWVVCSRAMLCVLVVVWFWFFVLWV